MEHEHSRGFASRAVHAGERPVRPDFVPTSTPIYPSTTFSYSDPDTADAVFANEHPGYVYTRHGNPTIRALETAIAALEGTEDAMVFGSGMAALHTAVLNEVQAGSRIVAARDIYGATYAMFGNIFATLGVKTTWVDILDLDEVARTLDEVKPRAIVFETISNPLLRVPDMAAIVEIAHKRRVKVIVDNTFATPLLVNPAKLGVDSVVHSTTKYLGGHGDATGGAIAASAERIFEIGELAKLTGAILGPFEAWLTLRGIKTLPLRMRQQCQNAQQVANALRANSRISRVWYSDETAAGREGMFNGDLRGAIIAFEISGAGQPEAFRFLKALRMCVPATTLGDVYTLVVYPPMSTHRALTPEQRAAIGITDGMVRLSVGIEDAADIIADLEQALAAI